jgi:release factor glutamine methyltransferase
MARAELDSFKSKIQRRVKHEPVAMITGEKEFWSMKFKVGPGVLIPRPETELIIENILTPPPCTLHPTPRILDIGTGSGILAIVLAKEIPSATVEAWDISEEALAYARENAKMHDVAERIKFGQINVGAGLKPAPTMQFNLIVSNPPYIATAQIATLAPEVSRFDPRQALDGGEDGLDFYRCLGEIAPFLLKPQGQLVVEIGEDQGETVPDIFQRAGFKNIEVKKDYSGLDRVVIAR